MCGPLTSLLYSVNYQAAILRHYVVCFKINAGNITAEAPSSSRTDLKRRAFAALIPAALTEGQAARNAMKRRRRARPKTQRHKQTVSYRIVKTLKEKRKTGNKLQSY